MQQVEHETFVLNNENFVTPSSLLFNWVVKIFCVAQRSYPPHYYYNTHHTGGGGGTLPKTHTHMPVLISPSLSVVLIYAGPRAFISTDGPFLSEKRGKVFPNGTLLIMDLELTDSQKLTCEIIGPGGQFLSEYNLMVFSKY